MQLHLSVEILKEHSKSNTTRVSKIVDSDPERFDELMTLFFDEDNMDLARKAAWVLRESVLKHPGLIIPYLSSVISYVRKTHLHPAIRRNVFSILVHVEILEELEGTVADLCFESIARYGETIAVKAYAMRVLEKMCVRYPDLRIELGILVRELYSYESKGFQARARKILKKKL